MKRSAIIIYLVLTSIISVFSQEMQLNAVNQPLNKILNMLGVEISFDDKALSEYKASVSKKFKNPEEALYYLLNDKPFKIDKVDNVYIILSLEQRMNNNNPIVWTSENKEQFIFSGKVSDQLTHEPLSYATVYLLDSDNQPLITGVTNDVGSFQLATPHIPKKIKISFLGYETLFKDALDLKGDLGLFSLSSTPIQLKETVVKTDDIRYKADRTNYSVTTQMCEGASNAEELLSKIPGIQLDKVSNTIKVNNRMDVLLLVDGMQQPADYIKNLSPQRISSVEVIHESSGRFVSDGYVAIINLILKKNYCGYDVYAANFMAANTSGTNGSDWLTDEQPTVSMTYTNNKINLFGTYSSKHERWNMPVSKQLIYNGIELLSSQTLPDKPNDSYHHQDNNFATGFNYQITPRHLIGIQGDYTAGANHTNQVYIMQRTDIQNQQQRTLKNTTENKINNDAFIGTLFYQGKINNRFRLHGDFTYNYYHNDIENNYNQNDALNYKNGNEYNEYKNHTIFNTEGQYVLSSKVSMNFGYSNVWRKYGSESSHGRGFLDYREYRNKAFAYLMFNPSDRIDAKLGLAIEQTQVYNRDIKNSYGRILPYVQMNFKANKTINIHAGYTTNQHYPSLYQLSPMSMVIDTFLTQIGNPELKSAIRHTASIKVSFWDKLAITPIYCFIHDEISELYTRKDYKLYRTFNNIDTREYSIQATYNQPIGKYLGFKNTVTYYYGEAPDAEIRNTPSGWLMDSEINYYHPEKHIGFQLGYYRDMKKQVLGQGYQMVDKDNWLVTANKEFWNKRISIMLSYIPPISWGIRYYQIRALETSLYKENTILHLESYNHMLLLRVNIRFGRGTVKPIESRKSIQKDEREKQTIEFQ